MSTEEWAAMRTIGGKQWQNDRRATSSSYVKAEYWRQGQPRGGTHKGLGLKIRPQVTWIADVIWSSAQTSERPISQTGTIPGLPEPLIPIFHQDMGLRTRSVLRIGPCHHQKSFLAAWVHAAALWPLEELSRKVGSREVSGSPAG